MTANSGDQFSGDMIFPPFVPRAAPPAPPSAPPPAPQPAAAAEAIPETDPWTALEAVVESGAPDVADTADGPAEDLPWLELSVAAAPAPTEAEPVSAPVAEEGAAEAPAVPEWMSWDPDAPAAAVTETPEMPPSGDVDASAAAREAAEDAAAPLAGLESFDRDATAEVEPVDGLAPVGDFDVPMGEEPPAAYETPAWAQPAEEWAAPPSVGEDPLLTAPAPSVPADLAGGADDYAGADAAADEPVASALDAELAALLDAPTHAPVEAAAVSATPAGIPTARGDDRLSTMLGEVAERLESIARSLRDRTPAEVLAGPRAGAADPLELLVTGFVLGYLQRGGER